MFHVAKYWIWLKEHCDDFSVRERMLRRYVAELRQKHDLPKPELTRHYQAVADLPPGKQLQVVGQKRVRNNAGGYAMGAVLAYSRYKYGQWADKALTAAMFVRSSSANCLPRRLPVVRSAIRHICNMG